MWGKEKMWRVGVGKSKKKNGGGSGTLHSWYSTMPSDEHSVVNGWLSGGERERWGEWGKVVIVESRGSAVREECGSQPQVLVKAEWGCGGWWDKSVWWWWR